MAAVARDLLGRALRHSTAHEDAALRDVDLFAELVCMSQLVRSIAGETNFVQMSPPERASLSTVTEAMPWFWN